MFTGLGFIDLRASERDRRESGRPGDRWECVCVLLERRQAAEGAAADQRTAQEEDEQREFWGAWLLFGLWMLSAWRSSGVSVKSDLRESKSFQLQVEPRSAPTGTGFYFIF